MRADTSGLLGAGLDGMESDVDALGSVTVMVVMDAKEVEREDQLRPESLPGIKIT